MIVGTDQTTNETSQPTAQNDVAVRYLAVLHHHQPVDQTYRQLEQITCQFINARLVRWFDAAKTPAGLSDDHRSDGDAAAAAADQAVDSELAELASRVIDSGQPLIEASDRATRGTNVVIPVSGQGALACRLVTNLELLPSFVALLKMSAGYFAMAGSLDTQRQLIGQSIERQLAVRLTDALFAPGSRKECVQKWCATVMSATESAFTSLSLVEGRRSSLRFVAAAGGAKDQIAPATKRLVQDVARECVIAGAEHARHVNSRGDCKCKSAVTLANHLGVKDVTAFPLLDDQREAVGAVVIASERLDPQRISLAQQAANESVSALRFRIRAGRRIESAAKARPWYLNRSLAVAATIAALIGLMMVEVPYRVRCDARLTPESRRIVTAPYDGVLTEAKARSGDVIRVGQTLALLDNQQFKLELSRNGSEQARVRKQIESALAAGEISDVQFASFRLEELEAAAVLLQQKIDDAVVTASIDGVVISQDLDDVEDSPVSMGQPLYEIAPQDRFRVELEVAEQDAYEIQIGQPTELWIDDGSGRKKAGEIARVAPKLDLREDRNTLVCEYSLANDDGSLRPGMKGKAAIDVGPRRIGWIVFHRLWHRIRVYAGI